MIKNILKALSVMISSSLVLWSLGCSTPQSEHEQVLKIWGMGHEGDNLIEIVKEFNKFHPKIKLDITTIPWDEAYGKLITAVKSKEVPDVSQFGTTWIPEFVALDELEPLDEYINESEIISKEHYFDESWKTGLIHNFNYGVPWYVDTRVLFYRTDILKAIGFDHAPRTWFELKDICHKLIIKDKNNEYIRKGISLAEKDAKTLAMFMWSNGGDILNDDLEVVINTSINIEALKYYTSFFNEGLAEKISTKDELITNFKSGFTPLFIGGSWLLKELERHDATLKNKWQVATLPIKKTRTSFVGGSSFCIFKSSNNKTAAWKFIEFMSRPDIQIKWYSLTTDLPTRIEAWENSVFIQETKVKIFGKQLFDIKALPRIQKWEEIESLINKQMVRVSNNKITAKQAIQLLEKDIKKITVKKKNR